MDVNVNKATVEFYEAANQSKLIIQKCKECDEHIFFPRGYCPKDMGELEFIVASGNAKILTYTIVVNDGQPIFKDLVPFVAAVVELEEGPRMYTRIITDHPEEITFNQDVVVTFEDYKGSKIPLFKPV